VLIICGPYTHVSVRDHETPPGLGASGSLAALP
jgi:hypothetical protein